MIGEIIPVIKAMKANKIIKKKNQQEIEVPEKIRNIDIKCLEEEYKTVLEMKNRFEDKAKAIITALTIAITLILNLSKIIDTIAAKYNYKVIDYLIFGLAVMGIIYMLFAGIMSIQVLIKENVIYPLSAEDRAEQDIDFFYQTIQYNVNQNLIRNNIIFAAYHSIRNSVLCLVIIFVLAIFPYQDTMDNKLDNANKYENICFGVNAVNWINENSEIEVPYDKIVCQYEKINANNEAKNIYDKNTGIIVTIKKETDFFVIENIICEIEEIE